MLVADIIVSSPLMIGLVVTLAGGITGLFWMLIASKEREHVALLKEKERDIRELENLWKSFRDISTQAVATSVHRENAFREKSGLPPMTLSAAVIPEAFSPSTELSRINAEIATLRATLVQVRISAGIEPTPVPEEGKEKR